MPMKPFRTPLIRQKEVIHHTSDPPAKRRRIREDVEDVEDVDIAEFKVPPRPTFKLPEISSIHRDPFATIKNPAVPRDVVVQQRVGAIEPSFDGRRYNVLWYVRPCWIWRGLRED